MKYGLSLEISQKDGTMIMIREGVRGIILGRRSIRRYQDRPVPREVLEAILTAAIWAPSAHNRQPWRFAVITSPDVRTAFATAMGMRLRADLEADRIPQEVIDQNVSRSFRRISGAPVVVLACLSMADMDRYPDARRAAAEHLMAAQSTALAVQNLLLAAHAEGLGACWMCAPLFCPDVVTTQLDLPGDWEPQALITMGYPAEQKQSARQPLESRVIWR
jgi:coenzyme F420-0:L-glutamate ligase/coenzyme F420-1:gamma-L-glutamate ligase